MQVLQVVSASLEASWQLLLDSSAYVLFGILVGGLLKVFLSPSYVARHLGEGKITSVVKAALLGIPIPLCSCGVLPAAASLKKQGANNGATTAFLISTPESGVDSISISYALLDPILTVARPLSAFVTALVAGISENLIHAPGNEAPMSADLSCQIDKCCTGEDCSPEEHARHHTLKEKLGAGVDFAVRDLWADLAGWFLVGILLAGLITSLVPDDMITRYLGGGLASMGFMLLLGVPLYICATASTPIAAALIMKGVSPGAALVFLLVGPATNMASLSVLLGIVGRRATVLYLVSIAVVSVGCGMALDIFYTASGISARSAMGQASEVLPFWLRLAAVVVLAAISIGPLTQSARRLAGRIGGFFNHREDQHCECTTGRCADDKIK
jgi:uncharacterized membrane protein YraQ (UPF0718 family)